MKADAIPADRLDEAFGTPGIHHQATANRMGASTNEETVEEEEPPLVQNVRTVGDGKAEPQEPTWNMSPFSEDGSIRADDSWLKGDMRSVKKQRQEDELARRLDRNLGLSDE